MSNIAISPRVKSLAGAAALRYGIPAGSIPAELRSD